MEGIAKKVYDAIKNTADDMGYEIVDVEYQKKYGDMHLTVFIHQEKGIGFEDCEKLHLAIDPIIDDLNPSSDTPYFLNVSSPGLDRAFKTDRDYERNYGKEVEVKLYAPLMGKKIYEGVLLQKSEGTILLDCGGQRKQIELTRIALTRPLVKFD